jgi:hypothetical protein
MLRVFLGHSCAQKAVAMALAARLDWGAEARVECWQAGPDETVLDGWEDGLDASALVLLLDPAIVPEEVSRDQWAPLLKHLESRSAPPVALFLAQPCRYPKLLERFAFFRPGDERRLVEWVQALHVDWSARAFEPAPFPRFTGMEAQRETLWAGLVDRPGNMAVRGPAGAGKTALVHQFAREAAGQFRAVIWASCGDRPAEVVQAELAGQLGVAEDDDIAPVLAERRLLVVLDDVAGEAPVEWRPGWRTSVVTTSRNAGEGLELTARAPRVHAELNVDATNALISLSLCDRNAAPVRVTGRAAVQELLAAGVVDAHDAGGEAVRVVAPLPGGDAVEHARAVYRALAGWREDRQGPRWSLGEGFRAFEAAAKADFGLATALGERAARYCEELGRRKEAAWYWRRMVEEAERRGLHGEAAAARRRLGWLVDDLGQLRPALAPGEQISLF